MFVCGCINLLNAQRSLRVRAVCVCVCLPMRVAGRRDVVRVRVHGCVYVRVHARALSVRDVGSRAGAGGATFVGECKQRELAIEVNSRGAHALTLWRPQSRDDVRVGNLCVFYTIYTGGLTFI